MKIKLKMNKKAIVAKTLIKILLLLVLFALIGFSIYHLLKKFGVL